MSLQDDIFDCGAALKGKPEAKAFLRLMNKWHEWDSTIDEFNEVMNALGILRRHFNKMNKENGP